MILLHPIKCNGKFFKAGPYKGGLPKDIEKQFKDDGYFTVESKKTK